MWARMSLGHLHTTAAHFASTPPLPLQQPLRIHITPPLPPPLHDHPRLLLPRPPLRFDMKHHQTAHRTNKGERVHGRHLVPKQQNTDGDGKEVARQEREVEKGGASGEQQLRNAQVEKHLAGGECKQQAELCDARV